MGIGDWELGIARALECGEEIVGSWGMGCGDLDKVLRHVCDTQLRLTGCGCEESKGGWLFRHVYLVSTRLELGLCTCSLDHVVYVYALLVVHEYWY